VTGITGEADNVRASDLRGTVGRSRRHWGGAQRLEVPMPAWLILVLVGVVLVILGVATNIGQFLIWVGVIILVASLVLGLVRRSRT